MVISPSRERLSIHLIWLFAESRKKANISLLLTNHLVPIFKFEVPWGSAGCTGQPIEIPLAPPFVNEVSAQEDLIRFRCCLLAPPILPYVHYLRGRHLFLISVIQKRC